MRLRPSAWPAVFILLVMSACTDVPMEPVHPELASGQHQGWDWILAGEANDALDEVCIELRVSPGGSVHGGPDCHPVPEDDGADLRAGSSGSSSADPGQEEIANVRAVVGSDVAGVHVTSRSGSTGETLFVGETVFVKEDSDSPGWFVFLYNPQQSDLPGEVILLDEDGNELERLKLTYLADTDQA